jgi:hypothetical protein
MAGMFLGAVDPVLMMRVTGGHRLQRTRDTEVSGFVKGPKMGISMKVQAFPQKTGYSNYVCGTRPVTGIPSPVPRSGICLPVP